MHRRWKARRLAGLLLSAALLGGCASAPQTRQLTGEPAPALPARAELDEVAFFPQERYQCGPAALATLLDAEDRRATPDELVGEVYVPARQGSLRPEMRAAIRARGLVAYPLEPELRALLAEIAAGRPVLVMQNLGLSWAPRWHYAVAVGYDLDEREIVLRSGTIRRRITSLATFERTWARADHWAQLAVPPDDPPGTADPLTWLEAVHELEATGRPEAAARGYRAGVRRWPGFRPTWLAWGNSAYAAGHHAEAGDAFRRAVALDPAAADAWNNLAHALAAEGCGSAAVEAARCAASLADGAEHPAHDTLQDLQARDLPPGPGCPLPTCPASAP